MVRNDNTATSMPNVAVGAKLPTREVQGSTFRSAAVCSDCYFSGISYSSRQMLGLYFKIDHDLYTITQQCNNKTQYRPNYSPLLDPTRLGSIISHPCPCHKASVHVSFATSKTKGYLEIGTFMVGRQVAK